MFINLRTILVSIALLVVLAVAATDSASASIQNPPTLTPTQLQNRLDTFNNLVTMNYESWAAGYETNRRASQHNFMDWSHDNCSTPANIPAPFKGAFVYACRKHDFMWRTLAAMDQGNARVWNERNRSFADQQFRIDTKFFCEHVYFFSNLSQTARTACLDASRLFYDAVHKGAGFRSDDTRTTAESNSLDPDNTFYVNRMMLMTSQDCNYNTSPTNRCLPINYIEYYGKPFAPQNIDHFPMHVSIPMTVVRANQQSVKGPPSNQWPPPNIITGHPLMRTTELRLRAQTPFVIGKTEELDCANPANHRIIYADTNEYPWVVNGVNASDAELKRTPIYLKGCSATSSSQEDSPQIDIHPMKGRLESNNIYPTQQSGSRLRHYQHINSTASPANITPNPGTFEFTQAGAWYGPFTFSTSLPLLSMLAVFNPNDDTPLIEVANGASSNLCRHGADTNERRTAIVGSGLYFSMCDAGDAVIELHHPTRDYLLNRYTVTMAGTPSTPPTPPTAPVSPPSNLLPADCTTITPLSYGTQTVRSTWTTASCRSVFRPASYVNYYSLTPSQTGNFVFWLTSSQDTWLLLYEDRVTAGAPFAENNDHEDDSNSWLSLSLTAGTTYVIGITTWPANAIGSYALQMTMPVVTGGTTPVTPPAVTPLGVPSPSAQAGHGAAIITWPAVADATGYEIQQRRGTTGTWSNLTGQGYAISGTTITVTVTGLTNGVAYGHRVRAKTDQQQSGWSTPTLTTPVNIPLGVPAVSLYRGNATITLTWTAIADATGYQIQQREGGATGTWQLLPTQGYTISGTTITAVITGLTNGVPYEYQVKATSPLRVSAWSTSPGSLTPFVILRQPTGLTFTPRDRSVILRWNSVLHAHEYEVQQWVGTVTPGEWRILPFTEYPYTYPFTVSFDGVTATVGNLLVASSYAHRVRAVNGEVNGPWSGWRTTTTNAASSRGDSSTPAPKGPVPTPTPAPPAPTDTGGSGT